MLGLLFYIQVWLELVDTSDLGSDAVRRKGSNPFTWTNRIRDSYMSYYGRR